MSSTKFIKPQTQPQVRTRSQNPDLRRARPSLPTSGGTVSQFNQPKTLTSRIGSMMP